MSRLPFMLLSLLSICIFGTVVVAQWELPAVQEEGPIIISTVEPFSPIAVPATSDVPETTPDEEATVPRKDETPKFDPNDARANELWTKLHEKSDLQEKLNEATKNLNDENARKKKLRLELAARVYDLRMAELARVKPKADPDFSKLELSLFNYPEIDGSESCQNLALIIVCRSLGIPYKWGDRPDPNATPDSNNNSRNRYRSSSDYSVWNRRVDSSLSYTNMSHYSSSGSDNIMWFKVVPDKGKTNERAQMIMEDYFGRFIGSNGAYMSLIGPRKPRDGETPRASRSNYGYDLCPAEILIVDRKPSSRELETMTAAEVELDIQPIGYDALVFVTGRDNPVNDMKLEDIKEIYLTSEGHQRAGKNTHIFNWKEYGGPDKQVNAYDHQHQVGFREILDLHLLGLDGEQRNYSRRSLSYGLSYIPSTIISDPWALTYSLHSWEHFTGAGNLELKTLSINGIEPSLENINSKKYPLIVPIYVVTKKGIAPDSSAAKLRDWLLTTNGQRLVLEAGYVPVRARD